MFLDNVLSKLNKNRKSLTKDELASILKTDRQALEAFEQSYNVNVLNTVSDNFFEVNAKQAAAKHEGIVPSESDSLLQGLINRIIEEFIAQTEIYRFNGHDVSITESHSYTKPHVTLEELKAVPEDVRPWCAGTLMRKDIDEPAYYTLVDL